LQIATQDAYESLIQDHRQSGEANPKREKDAVGDIRSQRAKI